MMERFGAWVVGEGTGGSEREDEQAVQPLSDVCRSVEVPLEFRQL